MRPSLLLRAYKVQRTVFARYGSFELHTSLLKSVSVLCSVWTLSSALTLGSTRMSSINLTTRSRPPYCSHFSNRSEAFPSRRFHVIADGVLPSECSRRTSLFSRLSVKSFPMLVDNEYTIVSSLA